MEGKCFICAKLTNDAKYLHLVESSIILQQVFGLSDSSATNSIVKRFQKVCYCPDCHRRLLAIQKLILTQVPEGKVTLKKEKKLLWQDLLSNYTNSKIGMNIPPLGMLQLLRNEVVEEVRKSGRKDFDEILYKPTKSDQEPAIDNGSTRSLALNNETDKYLNECLYDDDGVKKEVNDDSGECENDNSTLRQAEDVTIHRDRSPSSSFGSDSSVSSIKTKKFTPGNESKKRNYHGNIQLQQKKISKSKSKKSNSYKCKGCGEMFTNRIAMNDHVSSLHRKNGRYACLKCEYTASDISHLRSHYFRHSDQRNFHCDECNRSFKEARNLRQHKKVHLRVGPFKCKYCPLEFNEFAQVRKHESREHPIPITDKKFQCDECNARFKTKGELNDHNQVHRGELDFKCIWCLAKFRTSNALTYHIRGEYCTGINDKAEN